MGIDYDSNLSYGILIPDGSCSVETDDIFDIVKSDADIDIIFYGDDEQENEFPFVIAIKESVKETWHRAPLGISMNELQIGGDWNDKLEAFCRKHNLPFKTSDENTPQWYLTNSVG